MKSLLRALVLAGPVVALGLAGGPSRSGQTPVPAEEWPAVGHDPGGGRRSPLAEVNRENVARLRPAWTYRTGDAGATSTIECTPVVLEGKLYLTTCNPRPRVVALDAATGRELWQFDPYPGDDRGGMGVTGVIASGGVNRGVALWSDGRPGGQRRVIHGTADGRLISLDAATGRPDPAFGRDGTVDLRDGLEGVTREMPYGLTSAPAIYRDLAILGFTVSEGPPPGAPGDIRAFNIRNGRERWRFRTIPRPGEFGGDSWPEGSLEGRSGVNAWGGLTVDIERGIVFAGTGSAAHDWHGGDRAGDNLFANCTLALDAATGRRLWHFQTVRHDIWDYDNPCPPVLGRIRRDGRAVDVAVQVTKTGFCFVFERETGRPLHEIAYRPVPQTDVPGERTALTQPFPVRPPPLVPERITEEELTDRAPEARAFARERLRRLRHEGMFTPVSLGGSLVSPGWHGGATWSGASFDVEQGLLYVNTNNTPCIFALRPRADGGPGYDLTSRERLYSRNSSARFQGKTGREVAALTAREVSGERPPRMLDFFYFNDHEGYPAVKPPWGFLTAIDLGRGEFRWRVPLGEYPELAARGMGRTGTENFGGSIVTAGGLVFIGGAQDERFHAFDSATGRLLWEHPLPAGGYATPGTYRAGGKQFVVIAAGGGGKLHTKSADAIVAFALP